MLRHILGAIIVSFAFLFLNISISAQTSCATPIQYNIITTGIINNTNWQSEYCFWGTAGDQIEINMITTIGNLDPFITIRSSFDIPLDSNDDADSVTLNSKLTLTLPDTTEYIIDATRFDGASGTTTGEFTIQVKLLNSDTPINNLQDNEDALSNNINTCLSDPNNNSNNDCSEISADQFSPLAIETNLDCNSMQEIFANTPISNTINDTTPIHIYCYNATQGEDIRITMSRTSGNLDTYIRFYDDSELFSIDNDDISGSDTNSSVDVTIPRSGLFFIDATQYQNLAGSTAGSYTLEIQLLTSAPQPRITTEDIDGDGVSDTFDACPTQGAAIYGLTREGCPIDDAVTACSLARLDCGDDDNDGFPNAFDPCPNNFGEVPHGCPATFTVPIPPSPFGGLQIACDNIDVVIDNGVKFGINMRAGFTYTATVVGLDGFDPILAVVNDDGSITCNDDSDSASEYQFHLPSTDSVEANQYSSQVTFSFDNSFHEYGNIQLVIGDFSSEGGEYVLILEGMVVTPNDPPGDPFSNDLTSNITSYPMLPFVYMIGMEDNLDPFVTILDDQYGTYMNLETGQPAICDDGGTPTCWGTTNIPLTSTYYIQTSTDDTLVLENSDVMFSLSAMPQPFLPRIIFLMTSLNQQTLGEYMVIFHMGID